MAKEYKDKYLWSGIDGSLFEDEQNIEDTDLADYNKEKMIIFSANVNLSRQLIRLSDSLKPVERRILYTMYEAKAFANARQIKCSIIVGNTMKWHPHGDGPIYKTLVGMAQDWKKGVPLIRGKGNFGNIATPDTFAQMRYTEATMSKYAQECFFEDFDYECIETRINTANSQEEPISLPSKFPNVLVNGGIGIAVGNSFRIPPFNVNDIVDLCKRLILNPNDSNIYIYPDLPTGCDIVNDERGLRDICDKGDSKLRMRSRIDIEDGGNVWILKIRSIPWLTSLENIDNAIVQLTKTGVLPIKERQNHSTPYTDSNGNVKLDINVWLMVSKTHDPKAIKAALYRSTELEKTVSIMFNTVDDLTVGMKNMRSLVLSWIDVRREYKRRLFNKQIVEYSSRISLLEILIELLQENNIEKTIKIIKNSDSKDAENALINEYGMSSFQARKIINMRLNAFTKDARDRYIKERDDLNEKLENIKDIIKSEKRIDKIILSELDDLRKYASPRKSKIISIENESEISDTEHSLIISNEGKIKKVPFNEKKGSGPFAQGDYPIHKLKINNLDSVIMFDTYGKYSIIPVHTIDNTEYNSYGNNLYEFTKLEGKIVAISQYIGTDLLDTVNGTLNEKLSLISLTSGGMIKKSNAEDFISDKTIRNVRCVKLKDDDLLTYSGFIFDSSKLLIYTKKGKFVYINCADILTSGKDSQGSTAIVLEDGDVCIGCTVVPNSAKYIVIVTEKGYMKKCELEFLGSTRKKRDSSYLSGLIAGDSIFACDTISSNKNKIIICKRNSYDTYTPEDIPTLSRRANPVKVTPVPLGDNIIDMIIL